MVEAPTPHVWIIGRIQTNGPDDYAAVGALQDGLEITALQPTPDMEIDPDHDTETEPLAIVNGMSALDFFAYASDVLLVNPPHATDHSLLARIANLGIVPGEKFDRDRFDAGRLAEVEAGASSARGDLIGAPLTLGQRVNGWTTFTDTMGVYGNYYLKRAVVALAGLGANPPEDAIYPLLIADADGDALRGEQDYVIHFDADALPPVFAFWSITMYDGEGFQAANELDRFAIGDRDRLIYNDDGSLDIFVGHENPGEAREANWLPAPTGPLGITMRLYAPKPEALDGRWSAPPVAKA